jgi:hypothetical protein
MIAMCSYRNNENLEQFNEELCCLSKGFKALNSTYKKGVLKTAQGLLRVQRTHKDLVAEGGEQFLSSQENKNG